MSEARRLILATVVALGVYLAYQYVINRVYPPRPPAPPVLPTTAPADAGALPPAMDGGARATMPTTRRAYELVAGNSDAPLTLGGRATDALRLELSPRGAAVSTMFLTGRKDNGNYQHRQTPDHEEPFQILQPVLGPRTFRSFETGRIWLDDNPAQSWALDDLVWQTAGAPAADHAVFATAIRAPDGSGELLRITKDYALADGKPLVFLRLTLENRGAAPVHVKLTQHGPLGITRDTLSTDMRLVAGAYRQDGVVRLGAIKNRHDLFKAAQNGEAPRLVPADQEPLWAALADKYFAVYARPVQPDGQQADFVQSIESTVALIDEAESLAGDLLTRFTTDRTTVGPGEQVSLLFEIYAGPKDPDALKNVSAVLAAEDGLHYGLMVSAGQSTCCTCTFHPLPELMSGLLHAIHYLVRNFGVAIIILVIVVRTLLHPLSVFQQRSMYRMQEAMGRIQPRLAEIKERYANDKVKQNQEMMRIFAEENVNPAGNFVMFIPLFLQMPILVALWTALNTDIHLRHAPFDGWWIEDLSAPDALITFREPIDIPVLSWLPLIGRMFSDVPSLNLLPILMGVSMYLQQKYMPKPHHQAKLEAARKAEGAKPATRSGMTPEEQLRQQQMIANMMSIMFPLMFYYMPSGLNLYWMATNVFGIFESLRIRKQIEAERQRREREGPAPPKPRKRGMVSRLLARMAEQAEELQRKADELAKQEQQKKRK